MNVTKMLDTLPINELPGRDLTPEEETQMLAYREKWLKIAHQSGPSDRSKAKEAISKQYEAAGLPRPHFWIWLQSPLPGVYCAWLVHHHWKELRGIQINGGRGVENCRKALAILREQIGNDLPPDEKPEPVTTDVIPDEVKKELKNLFGGNWAADELAYFDYCREALGLRNETEKMVGAIEVAKHCGWVWPYEDVVIVIDRPMVKVDDQHRLHCEDGPAMEYSDGFTIWYKHGERVSAPKLKERTV